MLLTQKCINFDDMPAEFKRGVCCIKKVVQDERIDVKVGVCPIKKWVIDKEIPVFSQDRDYIENAFRPNNEEELINF